MKKKILTIVLVVLAVCLFTAACDENIWVDDSIPEHDHSQFVTKVEAKDSTCAEAGNIEFYLCICRKAFADETAQTEILDESEIIVPKKPHVFDRQSTAEKYLKAAATCTTKATYYYSCTCGEKGTETFEYGELAEHSLDDNGICTVCGDSDFEDTEGITYTLSSDKTYYSVTGYTGTATRVRIAKSYNNLPVKAIADGAFSNNYEVTEVIIPSSVTSIGVRAFYGCSSLTSVTIGSGVTSIGEWAFWCCYKLVEVINKSNLNITKNGSSYGDVAYYALNVKTKGASDIVNVDGYLFYTYNGTNYLLGYIGNGTDLVLPDKYKGQNYEIYQYAFYYSSKLTSVTIPRSVTSIGERAFYYCSKLTSATIPDSVTSIGDWAFNGCSSLTSVTIGSGVTSIGEWAFSYCYKLVEVINKSNLNITKGSEDNGRVAYYALNVKTKGASDIVNVDGYLFYTYNGTNYLLGYIGNGTDLVLPDKYNGQNYEIYQYAFYDCLSLISVTIGEGVTSIGKKAFLCCYKLVEVINKSNLNITKNGSSYGDVAYYALNVKTKGASDIVNVDGYLFYTCDGTNYLLGYIGNGTDLDLPDKYKGQNYEIYQYAFYYSSKLTSVTIPRSVTSIGERAFYYCSKLTSATIPDSVTSIGDWAFNGCSSLTSATMPDSLTSIGWCAFRDCWSLTSVTIPDSVTSIGNNAFWGCYKIIVKDNGVHYVGNWVVDADSSITSAIIKEGTRGIAGYAFSGCSSLTSVTIGEDVTSIGDGAFSGCTALTSVTIGNSVTSIGYDAFYGCSSLTSVTIGSGVTSIGEWAFSYCYKLVEVINKSNLNITKGSEDNGRVAYYALNVKTKGASDIVNVDGYLFYTYNGTNYLLGYIGNGTDLVLPDKYNDQNYVIYKNAFNGCRSLTSVIIPDGVTSIGDWAFSGCLSLTSVIIPDGVTSIGDWAFSGCLSLTSVYYKGTETGWNNMSIDNHDNSYLTSATRYYYSESNPFEGESAVTGGNYWHYDTDGKTPVVWTKD